MTADETAACLRQCIEMSLPGLVRGWYVTGSVGDGTAGLTSDIDLVAVTRDRLSEDERETIGAVARQVAGDGWVELDLKLIEASDLAHGADPQLKLGSRLLHGEDPVAAAPLVPIEGWSQERMHAAYYLMISVFGRPPPVREPLAYPRPHDPF